MPSRVTAPVLRRLTAVVLAALALAATATPAAVRAADPVDEATLTTHEAAMVAALNTDRTDRGLIALRTDARLMAI
ncbi:MAG TPA: hypothetical protein VFR93_09985, partial [Candidatus Limnocylindrales bacterium]|nr:hypothetical protein [Candidatus Limnocylindrales bacterium]